MFLFRYLQSKGQIMYLIEGCSQKKKLRLKDTTLRDNSVVTIGTCLSIPSSKAVKIFMADDIFLVITRNSVIVLKHPTLPPQFCIKTTITKNQLNNFASGAYNQQ